MWATTKGEAQLKYGNDDLKCMYDAHSKDYDQEIGMWCQGREQDDIECTSGSGRKRKTDNASSKPPSKRQAIRDEVEEIYANLREKHSSNYTAAQLRLWANMIQVGTHKDHDEPPKVPMFGFSSKSPKNAGASVADALAGVAEGLCELLNLLYKLHLPVTLLLIPRHHVHHLMKWVYLQESVQHYDPNTLIK